MPGVYIDAYSAWASNVIGAPWWSAPYRLMVMLLLVAVVLVVLAFEVQFGPVRSHLRSDKTDRESEVK